MSGPMVRHSLARWPNGAAFICSPSQWRAIHSHSRPNGAAFTSVSCPPFPMAQHWGERGREERGKGECAYLGGGEGDQTARGHTQRREAAAAAAAAGRCQGAHTHRGAILAAAMIKEGVYSQPKVRTIFTTSPELLSRLVS